MSNHAMSSLSHHAKIVHTAEVMKITSEKETKNTCQPLVDGTRLAEPMEILFYS